MEPMITTLGIDQLQEELVESDYRYFESGAIVTRIGGAEIAKMDGLESLAAGCVVQRIEASALPGDLEQWLASVEERLRELHCTYARFYVPQAPPELERAFRRRRYQSRFESGLLRLRERVIEGNGGACTAKISLQSITTEKDWRLKLDLHGACDAFPDGNDADAERWVALERRKTEAGYMQPYLVNHAGVVCGAVSAAPGKQILRLKNLVVHPAVRRQGIGRDTINQLLKLLRPDRAAAFGIFAVEGGEGYSLYRKSGFRPVVRQQEWLKILNYRG